MLAGPATRSSPSPIAGTPGINRVLICRNTRRIRPYGFTIFWRTVFNGRRIIRDRPFQQTRQMPVVTIPFTQPIRRAAAVNSYERIGSNLMPARRSASALKVSTPTRSRGVFGFAFYGRLVAPVAQTNHHHFRFTAGVCSSGEWQTRSPYERRFSYCRAQSINRRPPAVKPTNRPFFSNNHSSYRSR